MKKWWLTILILLFMAGIIHQYTVGEIYYIDHRPGGFNPWVCESLFAGASLLASGSVEPIVISYVKKRGPIGELYFIYPSKRDSAVLLFNTDTILAGTRCIIGTFSKGTPVQLMFVVTDTASLWNEYRGKKIYSGQNRITVDKYISERRTNSYGLLFCALGRIDSQHVECGFQCTDGDGFTNIMFEVTNVLLEGTEKNKLPCPSFLPTENVFGSPIEVRLDISRVGLSNIIWRRIPPDTVMVLPPFTMPQLRFTTDGSNPLTSPTAKDYQTSIILEQTTTLKTYAYLPGDTNWFTSEVMSTTYTYDPSLSIHHSQRSIDQLSVYKSASIFSVFDIRGKLVCSKNATNILIARSLASSVYIADTRFKAKQTSNIFVR